MKKKSKTQYAEPTEFFPKELRKKYNLGEYAEDANNPTKQKTTKKK